MLLQQHVVEAKEGAFDGQTCTVIFADDTVVCTERRGLVEESLVTWRYALEISGLKVSRRKIEYVCV